MIINVTIQLSGSGGTGGDGGTGGGTGGTSGGGGGGGGGIGLFVWSFLGLGDLGSGESLMVFELCPLIFAF